MPRLNRRRAPRSFWFLGVLVVLGSARGPLSVLLVGLLVAVLVVFTPLLVMATAFLVGVSDTWLDVRERHRAASNPES